MCFAIVRLSPAYVHPRTLSNISGNLPGRMQVVFYLALVAMALLWVTLWRFEITAKHVAAEMRRVRRMLGDQAEESASRRSAAPSLTHAGSAS
jgi:heme exporter protein C